jgi:hypothetical protein
MNALTAIKIGLKKGCMKSLNTVLNQCQRLRFLLGGPLVALLLLSLPTSPLLAQSPSSGGAGSDGWQFTVAPYLLIPWMDGDTTVRGLSVNVDVGPSQIFENLQFGAMGYFEAKKGKWAVAADAVYMALGTTVDRVPILGDRATADVDFNQGVYTFTGMRQLHEKFDFLFGARWNVLQGRLGFKGPLETVVKNTRQWVDPIVGLRFKQRLGGPMHLTVEGDIGGFGAGSDFAWQLFPVLGADVHEHVTIGVGYRVLGLDYEAGKDQNKFKYDVITQAIVAGVAFHF